jgi:hypothetical protein
VVCCLVGCGGRCGHVPCHNVRGRIANQQYVNFGFIKYFGHTEIVGRKHTYFFAALLHFLQHVGSYAGNFFVLVGAHRGYKYTLMPIIANYWLNNQCNKMFLFNCLGIDFHYLRTKRLNITGSFQSQTTTNFSIVRAVCALPLVVFRFLRQGLLPVGVRFLWHRLGLLLYRRLGRSQ